MTTPVDPKEKAPSISEAPTGELEVPNFYVNEYPWSEGEWGKGVFNPDAFNPTAEYEIPKGRTYEIPTNPGFEQEDPFDLENVRFFDHEKVKRMLRRLEGEAADIEPGSETSVIAMIGTGGTIAMKMVDGVAVPALDPETILGELPNSKRDRFNAAAIEFPTPVDNSKMKLDYTADTAIVMTWLWSQMTDELKDKFAGFMVTHGTDTMSESAAEMKLMLGPNCPFTVAMVGAQKKITDPFNDVSANIVGTLNTMDVLHKAEQPQVFVFMNGTSGAAMNAAGVIKVSDSTIHGFLSPIHKYLLNLEDFGQTGILQKEKQKVNGWSNILFKDEVAKSKEREKFMPLIMRGDMPVREITPKKGDTPAQVYNDIIRNPSTLGIALTTFGSFSGDPAMLRAVAMASEKIGVPFFAANPFPEGSTEHTYETAKLVKELGFVPVKMMPNALRTKLLLAHFMYGDDIDAAVRFVVGNNYVGEQPDGWHQPAEFGGHLPATGRPAETLPATN